MRCSQCGEKISKNMKRCPMCGKLLYEIEEVEEYIPVKGKRRHKAWKWYHWLIYTIVWAVMGVFGNLYFESTYVLRYICNLVFILFAVPPVVALMGFIRSYNDEKLGRVANRGNHVDATESFSKRCLTLILSSILLTSVSLIIVAVILYVLYPFIIMFGESLS